MPRNYSSWHGSHEESHGGKAELLQKSLYNQVICLDFPRCLGIGSPTFNIFQSGPKSQCSLRLLAVGGNPKINEGGNRV